VIVVGTGVLLGTAEADHEDHARCAGFVRHQQDEMRVPAPVIPETAWEIERISDLPPRRPSSA
jgi:hypothetical protein